MMLPAPGRVYYRTFHAWARITRRAMARIASPGPRDGRTPWSRARSEGVTGAQASFGKRRCGLQGKDGVWGGYAPDHPSFPLRARRAVRGLGGVDVGVGLSQRGEWPPTGGAY